MKILVTGAAGFIGSHSVERLLADGHEVIGVDNLRTGKLANLAEALSHPRFSFSEADVIADREALESLVRSTRPEAILHLVALVNVQECIHDPDLGFRLNLQATHRIAELARSFAVRRVVFASSAAVYGDATVLPIGENQRTAPRGPYGAAKLASEELLLGHAAAYGFSVLCLRYFNVYGPRQDASSPYSGVISAFAAAFEKGRRAVVFGDGSQTRDFISVLDVARANALALTAPGMLCARLNISTGREISVAELHALFSRLSGRILEPEKQPGRAGDISRSVGSPVQALELIGFRAEVSVELGLAGLIPREAVDPCEKLGRDGPGV
jgi:UDP-glucose 4-epimerase